jgi:hypothetical protein
MRSLNNYKLKRNSTFKENMEPPIEHQLGNLLSAKETIKEMVSRRVNARSNSAN